MAVPIKKCKPSYNKDTKEKEYYFNCLFSTKQLKEILMKAIVPNSDLMQSKKIEPIIDTIMATYQHYAPEKVCADLMHQLLTIKYNCEEETEDEEDGAIVWTN